MLQDANTERKQLALKRMVSYAVPSRSSVVRCSDVRSTPAAAAAAAAPSSYFSDCSGGTAHRLMQPSLGRGTQRGVPSNLKAESPTTATGPTRSFRREATDVLPATTTSLEKELLAKKRVLRRSAGGGLQLTAALSSSRPPPPAAGFSRTFSQLASASDTCLLVERSLFRSSGELRQVIGTPSMGRRVSFSEDAPHAASRRWNESGRKSRAILDSRPSSCDVSTKAATRMPLKRLESAPILQRNSLLTKTEEGAAGSPLRLCVGAAVGTSGQKPFIRQMIRRSSGCLVMPSLALRGPGGKVSLATTPSPMYIVKKHAFESKGARESNASTETCVPSTSAPREMARTTTREGTEGAKDSNAPTSSHQLQRNNKYSQKQSQQQKLLKKTSAFARSNTTFVSHLEKGPSTNATRNGSTGVPFARQVSQLCLMVLQERDRRLDQQKPMREREASEAKPKEGEEEAKLRQPPRSMDILSSSFVALPSRGCVKEAEAEEQIGSPEAVLECVRTVLEKRGVLRMQDSDTSMKLTGNSNEQTNACGVSSSICSSKASTTVGSGDGATHTFAAQKGGKKVEDMKTGGKMDSKVRYESPTDGEKQEEKKEAVVEEVEEDDDRWWEAEEDPWWSFTVLWCRSLESLPPPPDFVPLLDLTFLRIPDEFTARTTKYAIPMPTPVTSCGENGVRAGSKFRESSQCVSNTFTDTSDALAGGRGAERELNQSLRKLRIQLLLLETHERRSRRMVSQDETETWKTMNKKYGLDQSLRRRR
ncbi:hypothetical protein MOQ_006451 [Trypanosoma cruzi marinkellei]|uniref:Uncharacterized protein n=1 Tax=Trypanosoma cruzi marinkellei TaxID=85056 RepID=K2MVL2_TRYCR|nr:hypothetical protein MOQ_006451 [Trypanosoma cruzi marinkellei]